jgi:hypothetical protein
MELEQELILEELQDALLWTLAAELRSGLYQARLPSGLADALTKHLTLRMARLLDGKRPISSSAGQAVLRISFQIGREEYRGSALPWAASHVQSTLEALLSEPIK